MNKAKQKLFKQLLLLSHLNFIKEYQNFQEQSQSKIEFENLLNSCKVEFENYVYYVSNGSFLMIIVYNPKTKEFSPRLAHDYFGKIAINETFKSIKIFSVLEV